MRSLDGRNLGHGTKLTERPTAVRPHYPTASVTRLEIDREKGALGYGDRELKIV